MGQLTEKSIEQRAYELFIQRGSVHGYHVDDWLQAEREINVLNISAKSVSQPAKSISKKTVSIITETLTKNKSVKKRPKH